MPQRAERWTRSRLATESVKLPLSYLWSLPRLSTIREFAAVTVDENMHTALKHGILLALMAVLTLFTNLGGPRLWDRDEPRNAGCASEMLARGDWVTPWFNDELRTHKPVLLYWMIMSAYELFGRSEFAARFGSALCGCGTIACTYLLGRRLLGERAGLLAGIALTSSLMFDVAARAATPDAVLIFCCTAAITCYACGRFPSYGLSLVANHAPPLPGTSLPFAPLSWQSLCGCYFFVGAAALAKGPVGIVLPLAIMGLSEWHFHDVRSRAAGRNTSRIGRIAGLMSAWLHAARGLKPLLAIGIVGLVALPWYIAVGLRTDGEFLRSFFFEHNLGRALAEREGHSGGIWFYPLAILAGFFPWSVLALPTVITLYRIWKTRSDRDQRLVFLLVWVLVWVGSFSLASTKLPSYVTPCYPALALLTAWAANDWIRSTPAASHRLFIIALGVMAVAGVSIGIALPIASIRFLPGEGWLGSAGLLLFVGGVLGCLFAKANRRQSAIVAFAAGGFAFSWFGFACGPVAVDRHQESERFLRPIAAAGGSPQVLAFGCLEPSWVFYLERPIRELTIAPESSTATESAFKSRPAISIDRLASTTDPTFVITTRRKLPELRTSLGADFVEISSAPLFLKHEEIVLLSRQAASVAQRQRPSH